MRGSISYRGFDLLLRLLYILAFELRICAAWPVHNPTFTAGRSQSVVLILVSWSYKLLYNAGLRRGNDYSVWETQAGTTIHRYFCEQSNYFVLS